MPSVYVPDATNSAQPADTDYAYLQAAELRALKAYLAVQLAGLSGPVNYDVFKNDNLLINGNFDIWQKGTSQTSSDYASDDRWFNSNVGSTKVHTQQAFTIGQTAVPNNPTYYSRTVVTSVAGTANHTHKSQYIEDVTRLSGKQVTVSFWAKADSAKNIAISFNQAFGTGGSTTVESAGTKFLLSTTWTKYNLTYTFPSVSGKTIGVNNFSEIKFWFEAGSDFNVQTDTLGQQSGTFEIAQVKLEEGGVVTAWKTKSVAEELRDCQRYAYRAQQPAWRGAVNAATTVGRVGGNHPVVMRAAPTVVMNGNLPVFDGTAATTISAITAVFSSILMAEIDCSLVATLTAGRAAVIYQTGAAYVDVSAELHY